MDKKQAIELVKTQGVEHLLEILIYDHRSTDAVNIIKDCWGLDNYSVAEYIENNWLM